MVNFKKVSKSGGITIPLGLRRDYNIQRGDSMEVEADADGRLIIKRHTAHCIFCDSVDDIGYFKGKPVCKICAGGITKEGLTDGNTGNGNE